MSLLFKIQLQFRSVAKFSHLNLLESIKHFKPDGKNGFGVFRSSIKRLFATNPESNTNLLNTKLAENKTKNILVYSVKSKSSILLNSVGVVVCVMLLFTSYNTFLIFDSVRFRSRKFDDDGNFITGIYKLIASERFKYSLCSIVALLGIMSLLSTCFFTIRSVNKMYLLKGGKSLGIITEGLFGKTFAYELKLGETNFTSTRVKRSPHISFKNKNHYFFFLMNNIEGEFHEKAVFDHVICTNRNY